MNDLVRLFRALASTPRLQVLRLLTRHSECTVGRIADKLSMGLPLVSKHLAALRANGVVASRRQGRHVFCRLAESEGDAFLGALLRWLAPLLRAGPEATLEQVWPVSVRAGPSDADLIRALTAYTYERRLEMLCVSLQRPQTTVSDWLDALRMSPQAARRQTRKLTTRKVLREVQAPSESRYQPARAFAARWEAQLFAMVAGELRRRSGHT